MGDSLAGADDHSPRAERRANVGSIASGPVLVADRAPPNRHAADTGSRRMSCRGSLARSTLRSIFALRFLLVFFVLGGCGGTESTEGYAPRFEPSDCEFPVKLDLDHRCGSLVVPEDRQRLENGEMRLPVIRLRGKGRGSET